MLSGPADTAPWYRSLACPTMLPWGADAVLPKPDLGNPAGWSCAICHEVARGCGLGTGWTAVASCSVMPDAVEVALEPEGMTSWLKWSLVSSAPNVTLLFRRTFGMRASQLLHIARRTSKGFGSTQQVPSGAKYSESKAAIRLCPQGGCGVTDQTSKQAGYGSKVQGESREAEGQGEREGGREREREREEREREREERERENILSDMSSQGSSYAIFKHLLPQLLGRNCERHALWGSNWQPVSVLLLWGISSTRQATYRKHQGNERLDPGQV